MVCWVWVMLQVWLSLILKGKDQVKLINNYLSAVAGCVWLRVAIRD